MTFILKNKFTRIFLALFLAAAVSALPQVALAASVDWVGEYDWDMNFIPSVGGPQHVQNVDDSPCNGNTDYNWTDTVGDRDSYGHYLSGLIGQTITQIEISPCASASSTNAIGSIMDVYYIFDGVPSADAGGYVLTATTPTQLATTTFAGLNHVVQQTSNFKFGAVYTSGAAGVKLSNMRVKVTY